MQIVRVWVEHTSGNDNHFGTSGLGATDVDQDTCTNNFVIINNLNVNVGYYFIEGNLMSRLMVRREQETYKVLQLDFLQANGIGKLKLVDSTLVGVDNTIGTDNNTVLGTK